MAGQEAGLDRKISSVERYRAGKLDEPNYDLDDPLDRAIWCALQVYVDYLETADLQRAGRGGSDAYDEDPGPRDPTGREPWLLEEHMVSLRNDYVGKEPMPREERYRVASYVWETLFAPAERPAGGGRAVARGEDEYGAQRSFWEAGEGLLERTRGPSAPDAASPWGKNPTRVAGEAPLLFPGRLAPLFALVVMGFGRLVSQSEAARRLNLTPRGVFLRIERGEMRSIRVGKKVFVPEEDVEVAKDGRSRTRGRTPWL